MATSASQHARRHASPACAVLRRRLCRGVRRAAAGRDLSLRVDFEHQFDGRDAADGVRRKLAESAAKPRRSALPLMYTGLPLIPVGDVGALRLAAHLADDDVLLRTPHVFRRSR